jgi:hypothetical protein
MKRGFFSYLLNPAVLIGIIILTLSLIFFVTTLMLENRQKFSTTTRASPNIKILPAIFFSKIEDIQFIPRRINAYLFAESVRDNYHKLFPLLSSEVLKSVIVEHLIKWATLRDFYVTNNIPVPPLDPSGFIDATQVEQELPQFESDYMSHGKTVTGFFLKVRFSGIYPKSSKIPSNPSDVQSLARTKLDEYIEKASLLTSPSDIVVSFNADKTVALLNNKEPSKSFADYQLYPPLFDDPNFYTFIDSAPLNSFSPVIVLKTQNPQNKDLEEYAFVSFYINNKSGSYLPLDQAITEYLKIAVIR